MATPYSHIDSNIRKTWLLVVLFLVFIIFVGYIFSYIYNNQAILYFAIIFSVLMNIFSYWFSDSVVIKLSGAKPAKREEFFTLYTTVENLAITAGLPVPKVYVIEDAAPNAFATGRNKEHAVVAVTTGLLSQLNKNELEGVIAHELSHVGNRDILISTMVVVLVGLISIISDMFVRFSYWGRGDGNEKNNIGMVIAIIGFVLAILSPVIATLIQLAISRKREFLADASGVLLTRYPEGLVGALEKISAYSQPMKNARNITAHLYISNPFGKKGLKGMHKLFMTHPPIEERIKALREMSF